jgi:hypothetical protein
MLNKIGFKSFPMSELKQKQAAAKKQNKGVEIRMTWVDENPLPNCEAIGASCIVTKIGEPWNGRFKVGGKTCHYQTIEGFVDTVDDETEIKGFKKGSHPIIVNDKDVCISHDIKGIRDLPKTTP